MGPEIGINICWPYQEHINICRYLRLVSRRLPEPTRPQTLQLYLLELLEENRRDFDFCLLLFAAHIQNPETYHITRFFLAEELGVPVLVLFFFFLLLSLLLFLVVLVVVEVGGWCVFVVVASLLFFFSLFRSASGPTVRIKFM